MTGSGELDRLRAALADLEQRVAALEARGAASATSDAGVRGRFAARAPSGGSAGVVSAQGWTATYEPARLEVSETWIELHEHGARPQLQRLIRQVVEEEGPVTERLALDRVRRAWGLRRAGGRVQEAFDQAVRQLLARGLVERVGDALRSPGSELEVVRVPGDDELTRRSAEDVPTVELAMALQRAAAELGPTDEDELTMGVAKLFGWTRRGGSIQVRLDAALAFATESGLVTRSDGRVAAV